MLNAIFGPQGLAIIFVAFLGFGIFSMAPTGANTATPFLEKSVVQNVIDDFVAMTR
ncbi:MAG: hypothetical protein AAF367_03105 [Pseudomonadota bacterium]